MVTSPTVRRLEGPAASDDRSRVPHLRQDLAVDAGQTVDVAVSLISVDLGEDPVVETLAAVAERVVVRFLRPGNVAVERHRHVKNGCGHGVLLSLHLL